MVVALGPGRFYGSSLPRPRFYTDVKFNDDRVDPPAPVMDPLLSWANDAHWSMGGHSFKRYRLQGRIEGSIKKLRAQQDRAHPKGAISPIIDLKPTIQKSRFAGKMPLNLFSLDAGSSDSDREEQEENVGVKRNAPHDQSVDRKKRARRLGEEFDKAAALGVDGVAARTRSRTPAVEEVEINEEYSVAVPLPKKKSAERRKRNEVDGATPRRTSPRKRST